MRDAVRLRIRGLMPEKLIERARDMGARFHAIEPLGDHEIIVELSAADAGKLRALCERFSIPCDTLSRRGRSALAAAFKRRWTLLIGLLAGLAACWLLLGRVWRVDIRFTGESAWRGDAGAIAAQLAQMGVSPGAPRGIDTGLLSEELMARCDGLSYVGARLEGVRLLVEAAPEAAAPEVYDLAAARDLYADRGGIVVSVNVESGVACVSAGDVVRKGQRLIRGEERISKEETRGIAALGEVVIRTWYEGGAGARRMVERAEYTGRVSASTALATPWFKVPIVEGDDFARQHMETDALPIGGLYLPVSIERVTRRETRKRREETDGAALIGRLSALAMADARCRLDGDGLDEYEITRCWTRVDTTDKDATRVSAVIEITMNTAVTIDALRQGG